MSITCSKCSLGIKGCPYLIWTYLVLAQKVLVSSLMSVFINLTGSLDHFVKRIDSAKELNNCLS